MKSAKIGYGFNSVVKLLTMKSIFEKMFPGSKNQQPVRNLQPREKGIRNPKDPTKKAAIERRRKAKRLSMLSKPKRRKVYYHNLRNPQKMYA